MSQQKENTRRNNAAFMGGLLLLLLLSACGIQAGSQPTQSIHPTNQVFANSTEVAPLQKPFTQADINKKIGVGNWHCIDGYPTGISIDNMPENFVVQAPFVRVDKNDVFYLPGDRVPSGGTATGWLQSDLPNNRCSLTQPDITKSDIDTILGIGNWYCLEKQPTAVIVRDVPLNFVVQSPAIYIDKNDVRYYKDDKVPSGGTATLWFSNEIPTGDCP